MKTSIKKYTFISIGYLCFVLLFVACTEEVDMSFQKEYQGLVVDGKITTDTTVHRVILSKSGDPLNTLPKQFVSNAKVSITSGSDTIKLTENSTKKGVYETQPDAFGVPGKTYTLHISDVDINNDGVLETYSAQSELKNENPIDSISFYSQNVSKDFRGWSVKLYSRDIGGGRDYYLVKVLVDNKLITDSISEFGIANNSGFEGKYYPGLTVYFLNYNKTDEQLTVGKNVTLELDGITEDYYNFIDAYKQESMPKNPLFSGPSANPPTNIMPKTNASGFFAAYSVQRKSKIYTGGK